MKLKTTVVTSLFAIGTLFSIGAVAASDAEKTAEEKPATTETKKKIKPHSHVEAKGGPAPTVSESKTDKADKADPAKDKSKHYHPRDGK